VSEGGERMLAIGSFARRSRLSMKALRLYERVGLLSPARVDPENGYRWYREEQLFTARLIVALRRLDMPLSEVSRVLAAPGATGAELVRAYWEGVERRLASQRELAGRVRQNLAQGETAFGAFDVHERDVPEQIVLTEQRATDVQGLPATIIGAVGRLRNAAADHGGAAGELFVVFHGEVNEDGDGPVEVCLPVGTRSPATRCAPAHREAYVKVTAAQLEWPRILSAYDAVERWIDARGLLIVGSPREVYRDGVVPECAGPADEVCDIAFPIR
jgi:DNA-binding transcriptional MerR regulator